MLHSRIFANISLFLISWLKFVLRYLIQERLIEKILFKLLVGPKVFVFLILQWQYCLDIKFLNYTLLILLKGFLMMNVHIE